MINNMEFEPYHTQHTFINTTHLPVNCTTSIFNEIIDYHVTCLDDELDSFVDVFINLLRMA